MQFGDTVISEEHSIIGILAFNQFGEKVVIYSSGRKLKHVVIEEWLHDWKVFKDS